MSVFYKIDHGIKLKINKCEKDMKFYMLRSIINENNVIAPHIIVILFPGTSMERLAFPCGFLAQLWSAKRLKSFAKFSTF